MKKSTLILIFMLGMGLISAMAQSKEPEVLNSTNVWKIKGSTLGYINNTRVQEYKDTLNCLVRVIDTLSSTDKWVKAKVVFGAGLHNPTMKTTWSISYSGMAMGPFNNKVIFDKESINGVVIQVSIIEKNLFKP